MAGGLGYGVPRRHPRRLAVYDILVAPRVCGNSDALQQIDIDRNVESFGDLDQDHGAATQDRLGLGPGIKEIIHTGWAPTQWNNCAPTIYGMALRLCTSLP